MVEDSGIDVTATGKALAAARAERGLRVEDVAQRLCLSKAQVVAMEAGSAVPFPGKALMHYCVRRYAAMLNLNPELSAPVPAEQHSSIEHEAEAPQVPAIELHESVNATEDKTVLTAVLDLQEAPGADLPTPSGNGAPARRPYMRQALILAVAMSVVMVMVASLNSGDWDIKLPAENITGELVEQPAAAASEKDAGNEPAALVALTEPSALQMPAASATGSPKIIEVDGMDETIGADYFYASSSAATKITKRMMSAWEQVNVLDFPTGLAQRITIQRGEVIQVEAAFNSVEIYYQKRRLPPELIAGGSWIRFWPKKN